MFREKRIVHRELGDKYEGNSPHGRPRHRWVGENKTDLKETVRDDVECVYLAHNGDK